MLRFLGPISEQKDINAKFVAFLEMLLRIYCYVDVRQRLHCIPMVLN